jgi:hypothetical protein
MEAAQAARFIGDPHLHGEWSRTRSLLKRDRRVLTAQQHAVHVPKLDLRDYLVGEQEAPERVTRTLPAFGDQWLNDQLGDCAEAMTLNGIQTFHSAAGTPIPPFRDADAEAFYELVGNYDPEAPLVDGQNPTDQGTDNNVLVRTWQEVGVACRADASNHKIVTSVFVDPTDANLTRLGIWEFTCVFRAYGLPATAQEQQGIWSIVGDGQSGDSAPGSWGYHDICQQQYGPRRVALKTWGMPWMADWDFDRTYGVQGFVVITQEQTNLQGISPAGINWDKLGADIAKLNAPS